MKKPFQFLTDYYQSHKKLKRDFSVKPEKGEFAIDSGWRMMIPPERSDLLNWAVSDFQEYLRNCMGIKVKFQNNVEIDPNVPYIILEKNIHNKIQYL